MSQPLQLEQNEKLKEDLIARLGTPTTSVRRKDGMEVR